MGRYVFNADLQKKFAFMKFKNKHSKSKLVCIICQADLDIASDGKTSIERHIESRKHKLALSRKHKQLPCGLDSTVWWYQNILIHIIAYHTKLACSEESNGQIGRVRQQIRFHSKFTKNILTIWTCEDLLQRCEIERMANQQSTNWNTLGRTVCTFQN